MEGELEVLKSIKHPKLLTPIDLLEDNSNYFIVTKVLEGGEVMDLIKVKGPL
jgi:serine/threonine protein kinase